MEKKIGSHNEDTEIRWIRRKASEKASQEVTLEMKGKGGLVNKQRYENNLCKAWKQKELVSVLLPAGQQSNAMEELKISSPLDHVENYG